MLFTFINNANLYLLCLSLSAELWWLHLCILCHRNGDQNGGSWDFWQEVLPRRHVEPLGLLHSGGWVSYAFTCANTCTQTHRWPSITVRKHCRLAQEAVHTHTHATNLSSNQSASQDLRVQGGQNLESCFELVNVIMSPDFNELQGFLCLMPPEQIKRHWI